MSERSPEPWVVGISTDDLFGEPWPVYRLRDMRDPADTAEVEANRRLIAAAPDLLAALDLIANTGMDARQCADAARAAIAKAEDV